MIPNYEAYMSSSDVAFLFVVFGAGLRDFHYTFLFFLHWGSHFYYTQKSDVSLIMKTYLIKFRVRTLIILINLIESYHCLTGKHKAAM